MDKNELKYALALGLTENVGSVNAKELIKFCGSAEAVFTEKSSSLQNINGIGSLTTSSIAQFNRFDEIEEELSTIEKENITPLYYKDEAYPNKLKHCTDAPLVLFKKGNINFNKHKIVSVVGTRKATNYGKENCAKIIEELKDHNVIIASGLAYGIDICAHKAAIENNIPTVAVLAHGFKTIYPSAHRREAELMQNDGALLTEFRFRTNSDRENFPKRNRIVAGMADCILVMESAAKGGSLITAELGNSYNRDVFALPGKIGDSQSAGCNKLIKSNRAHLLESAKDIEYIMGWDKKAPKSVQQQLFVELTSNEQIIFDILSENGKTFIDEISAKANMPMSQLSVLLLNMEFSGVVKSLPVKIYSLN